MGACLTLVVANGALRAAIPSGRQSAVTEAVGCGIVAPVPHKVGSMADQEQLVYGHAVDLSDDVYVQTAGTYTVTLDNGASVNSLTSGRPRVGEAA
jgi:hypothetical protein